MDIKELFLYENTGDTIAELKGGRDVELPDVEKAQKALDPDKHDVNNPMLRKDKVIKVDNGGSDDPQKVVDLGGDNAAGTRIEKVARIRLALQELIISRAVSFLFGNEVAYNADTSDKQNEAVMFAFDKIIKDVKCNSINRKVARSILGFKECAELWYPIEKKKSSSKYGFPTKFKLRCAIFSPASGDTLYPYFDEMGDMIAFSREYTRKRNSKETKYFETYTDEQHWLWRLGSEGYVVVEGYPKEISIGKIPIVFGRQDFFETKNVDSLIDRLEKLLSNFADTNDYHASPKIFTTGQINGWSKKGEAGAVIEGEEGATMSYVSWQNAPESVKLEIETLLKMTYTISQTPDISFESVKGIGALSGVALKLLFMDAHLKVQDKRIVFDEYLQRRANIIKAYIGVFNTQLESICDDIDIEPEITPYMLTNEIDELNYWLTANGNKPVVSQEESIEKAKISKSPKDTYEKIQNEQSIANSFSISEPVIDA